MDREEGVLSSAVKQETQGHTTEVVATADPVLVNLEKIASDNNGGFGVLERVTLPPNNGIARDDEDLRNICLWLAEYDTKTLWIEPEHDNFAESMDQKEVPLLFDDKDIIHFIDDESYSMNNTLVQIKQEKYRCQEAQLVVSEMECGRENVEIDKLETVRENGNEATRNIPILGLERAKDMESVSDEKEGKVDNVVEEGKVDNVLEEGEIEALEEEVEEDDEEEEYYLIEEIIEEGEEEVEGSVERVCEPTREDLNDDKEQRQVLKHCKRKEYEVFVGGLHRFATREDVHKVFSQVGVIKSIRMARDRWCDENRGYAFVQYSTVEQAKCALTELKNPVVHGKRCEVTASQENDTLFIGNICKTWSQEHFKDKLKSYGVVNYKEVALIQDNRYQGTNKGFAFLEFWSLAQATWAYVHLHRSHVVFGTDRAAKVSFAVFDKSDREINFQAKTVFINRVPPTWDENMIRSCLQKYGFVESVKLARDMHAAKRPDFGYVTFDTHNSARRCIQGINAGGLGKGHRKVKVEAQFCRPRKPISKWNVKCNHDLRSRERSTHDLRFLPSMPKMDITPSCITNRIADVSVSPTRYRLKRPIGLTDREQAISVSKRPRHTVSFNQSLRSMLQDQERYEKKGTTQHIDSEYDSHHVIIERSSSRRNKYSYTSCEHVYSDQHSHSYDHRSHTRDRYSHSNDRHSHSHDRHSYSNDRYSYSVDRRSEYYDVYFERGSINLPRDGIEGCYCEYPKSADFRSPDVYDDLSIRRLSSRCDYAAISSRCHAYAKNSSRNRDEPYRGADELSYRGVDSSSDLHAAYISSSNSDRKYYYKKSDGGCNSYISFHEHSNCCDSTSQRRRDKFKRHSHRDF